MVPTIGLRVRALREARGLSGNALAKAAGISQGHLRDLEIGRHKNPTMATVQALARALGVTVDELLREVPTERAIPGTGDVRRAPEGGGKA